jgi:hypothetical protein
MMWTDPKRELPPEGKLVLVIRRGRYELAFVDHVEVVCGAPNLFSHTLTWRETEDKWEEDVYNSAVTHWTLLPEAPPEVAVLAASEDGEK